MKDIEYKNAVGLAEALEAMNTSRGARAVAGGTNVMVELRINKLNSGTLVNIRDIEALRGIRLENGLLKIGALTRIADIAASGLVRENLPALYMAANVFADPTTRNSATIGGNIAYGSPGADTVPTLMAADARISVSSVDGTRELSLCELLTGVNKTSLKPNELITEITVKPRKSGYIKLANRKAMAISVATAAAVIETDADGVINYCGVAAGSVAPTVVRLKKAETELLGKRFKEEALQAAKEAVCADISPIDDIRASAEYRRDVTPVLVERAIRLALFGECTGEAGK